MTITVSRLQDCWVAKCRDSEAFGTSAHDAIGKLVCKLLEAAVFNIRIAKVIIEE